MPHATTFRFAALLGLTGCFGGTETSPLGEIPPPPPPAPITVSMGPADAVLAVGGGLQYQAVSTSTVAGWDWSVLDPTRATVSTGGLLTGQAAGTSRVQACATNAPLVCGVALMVFPYFVSNSYLVVAIGVVLMAIPYFTRE